MCTMRSTPTATGISWATNASAQLTGSEPVHHSPRACEWQSVTGRRQETARMTQHPFRMG